MAENEEENLDCLNDAIEDMDNKLNLTADEKDNGIIIEFFF